MSSSPEKRGCSPAGPVLVVDDNADVRDALIALLEVSGYSALGAENGQDALHILRDGDERPCLILLDLNMPVMDGVEFRRRQLLDPAMLDIPTVVVSANDAPPRRREPRFDAFLKKPVDSSMLLAAVHRHCARA